MENKTIVLVKVESGRQFHPLSLTYVGGALKKAGYKVHLLHVFKNETEKYISKILEKKPLFIGFSVLTGEQTRESAKMCKKLKEKNKDIPIVWGGVHPSMLPHNCLREEFIDVVCIKEGMEAVCDISECFNGKKAFKDILGIGYKEKGTGKIIINPDRPLAMDLDSYNPAWDLLPEEDFEKCIEVLPDGRRQIDFLASRGCPYNCSFCYNLLFHERRWRKHSSDFVIEEISRLKEKYNIRAVRFHDDNFFANKERAFHILEELKKIDVISTSCLLRLELIDEDCMRRISDLNVGRLFVGWESGSNRMLKLMNKGFTKELIVDKFKVISKFPNILVTAASIIGFPTETKEEVYETINMGIKLAEMVPNIVITYQTFIPYPGSDLYTLAKKEGFKPPDSIFDYGDFNLFGSTMKLSWLPWSSKNTNKTFYLIDKYGKLLSHSKSSTAIRSVAKEFFYRLAKFRLRKRFFAFPFEIFILYKFNRYFNPKCPI